MGISPVFRFGRGTQGYDDPCPIASACFLGIHNAVVFQQGVHTQTVWLKVIVQEAGVGSRFHKTVFADNGQKIIAGVDVQPLLSKFSGSGTIPSS